MTPDRAKSIERLEALFDKALDAEVNALQNGDRVAAMMASDLSLSIRAAIDSLKQGN